MSIPVTVIGGYLGAGKTTLLNYVLRSASRTRFAVLVNDFGALNIDAELIVAADGHTVELANGCICCSLAGGFAEAMFALRERIVLPDHVLVEASGVADPAVVAQYAHLDGFRLDGIVVVADVEQIRARARDRYVGKHVLAQLRSADLVVLTKIDLVDAERCEAVRGWIGDQTSARIVEATYGSVPAELLFGLDPSIPTSSFDHPLHESSTWAHVGPFERARLEAIIDSFPADVVRAKGFVQLAEAPEIRHLVQLVGRRVTIRPWGSWPGPPDSRLVVISLPRLQETP